jgi:KaiC/GvpD/RAD55 family RecA-like ATPase
MAMYRKEVNEHSPIRILEGSTHGGLGKGNLGVVMARAGVGKTACLVQIGLDDLMREESVLHVALDQTVDHVLSWYDALFEDLALRSNLEDIDSVRNMLAQKRMIAAFADHDLWPDRLQKTVEMFKEHLDFRPSAILVDGYPWSLHSEAENAAMIGAFKSYAKMLDAELWMSAQTHRESTGNHPTGLTDPCTPYHDLIDVAVFLEPHGKNISLRLLKDHDNEDVSDVRIHLHPDTLRLVSEEEGAEAAAKIPNSAFTLLSGGAKGAEAEFGACAESWGLTELNFSFAGRSPARTRAIVNLTPEELEEGHVSSVYLKAHMHRTYPDTPLFQKTLQTIWHQVNTAAEVFSVGTIQDDKTVKGGTGWAPELAKNQHKPVFVFDQEREKWLKWSSEEDNWIEVEAPKITQRRFAGTGTRFLNDAGKAAIEALYQRSFGDKPSWL